jgi:hypothetical protein
VLSYRFLQLVDCLKSPDEPVPDGRLRHRSGNAPEQTVGVGR